VTNHVPQVVLETEFDNAAALALYESLGFIREKRLFRFYLNGKDAFRLTLSVAPYYPLPPRHADLNYRAIYIAPTYSDSDDDESPK
jgi:peptide alpha-N-acetyltransferase